MRPRGALVILLLTTAACARQGVTLIPESELDEIYTSPSPSPRPGLPRTGVVYLVEDDRLAATRRGLDPAPTLAEALLEALLREGDRDESRSAIPPETRVLDVGVVGGVATVDLSQGFEQGASGSDLALRVAQIVYTLTEDPEIRAVLIAIEGEVAPVIAGNQRDVLDRPVTRDDYRALGPPDAD
ncbi:MAG TPA: GerMN domain-containing protein [Actinomycetota bacterium]|nr:GerMN domain-containing protein [Actinomycetota bacterium]